MGCMKFRYPVKGPISSLPKQPGDEPLTEIRKIVVWRL